MQVNSDNFTHVTCAECGLEFCISKAYGSMRQNDCKPFWCPNGHGQAFIKPKGDSREVKKLKERVTQLETDLRKTRESHYDAGYVEFLEDHPEGYKRKQEAS